MNIHVIPLTKIYHSFMSNIKYIPTQEVCFILLCKFDWM